MFGASFPFLIRTCEKTECSSNCLLIQLMAVEGERLSFAFNPSSAFYVICKKWPSLCNAYFSYFFPFSAFSRLSAEGTSEF